MKVVLICLAMALMLMESILANPLIESGLAERTFAQLDMKCNTRSALKRVTMSEAILYEANSQNCVYTIRAYSTKICQLRINFSILDIEQPSVGRRGYADCVGDRLTIKGMQFDLCGKLTNQHVYVPFDADRLTAEMDLRFEIKSDSFALWKMDVNQIECNHKAPLVTPDERQAPDGCLQYFYEPNGRVESFNYGLNYFGNTHYAICFNRDNRENAVLELTEIKFEMEGTPAAAPPPTGSIDGVGDQCLDPAGAIPIKDYISIPFAEVITDNAKSYHSLFCLKSLDGNSLTFDGAGPIVIHVNTDETTATAATPAEKGFSFKYRMTTGRR